MIHHRHPRVRHALALIGVGLVGLLGAGIGIALFAHVTSPVGPFDATLSLRPSLSGGTVVQVAPLGHIRLHTHSGPLSLRARLDELRPSEATAIVRNPDALRGVESEMADDVRDGLRTLVLKAIVERRAHAVDVAREQAEMDLLAEGQA